MGSNVLLGHDGTTPVYLRFDHRTAHVAILGKSRFGKTTLLEHLVLQDMGDGIAVIVIDAHGDLTKRLISLAPPAARDKIVLVEANGDRPFGLNLYECADPSDATTVTTTVGHVVDIFNKLMGSESPGYRPVIEGDCGALPRCSSPTGSQWPTYRFCTVTASFAVQHLVHCPFPAATGGNMS